ncbi:MAG: adenylyltransferase/cytidyltransferase family protein [Clostridia bacterium]|nr:adenylyltransferase/cytidyltransferase family protein [Clostridia bacterium]
MVIGYTQGTYDMFHIGHLNLLRNAKKQCDYLIVGVNSDELVKKYKNKSAIVPVNERVDIISAIKYVDEVIVCDTLDKVEIYKKKPFDIIFIGDDWKGNKRWEQTEKDLSKLGAKLVYLPHTKGTSSTLLREKLNER